MPIRSCRRPAAAAIALACLAMAGCATYDRTKPAPPQTGPIAIHVLDDTLGLNDIPLGTYRVPDSQVVVSGRQQNAGAGVLFGIVGVLVADAVVTHHTASAVSNAERVLHIHLGNELRADLGAQISDGALKGRYTLDKADGSSLDILPAVILTYTDETHVRPFVELKVTLYDRNHAQVWDTRYFASTDYDRTMDGPGSWSDQDGAALKASISASLRQAVHAMLKDVATPYARDGKKITAMASLPFATQRLQIVGQDLDEDGRYVTFLPHIPDAFIATITSRGPGSGSGKSRSSISRSPAKYTPFI